MDGLDKRSPMTVLNPRRCKASMSVAPVLAPCEIFCAVSLDE